MENQIEKTMENEIVTGIIRYFFELGFGVSKYDA